MNRQNLNPDYKKEQWIPLMEKSKPKQSAINIYQSIPNEQPSYVEQNDIYYQQNKRKSSGGSYPNLSGEFRPVNPDSYFQYKQQHHQEVNPYFKQQQYQQNNGNPYGYQANQEWAQNRQRQSNEAYSTPMFDRESIPKQDEEIVHVVQPDDTLEGLSLAYGVSITKIKIRNKIETDSIYYMKKLYIPNPTLQYTPPEITDDIKIQHVMGFLDPRDRSRSIARFYLDDNDWEIEKAVAEYKNDIQWDKSNQIKSIPISQAPRGSYGKWLMYKEKTH